MNDDCQGEAAQMERIERRHTKMERLSRGRGCEQIDRIPDAPLLEKAVQAREYRHGHAAGEASFNSCRHRIGFERKQWPGEMGWDRQSFDFATGSKDDRHFVADFNRLFLFLRENIAKPSDASGHEEYRA